ncbi:frataxin, mitochondrial [Colletotrichum spaethianum]|uniref:ferroxidase n=1 Tax=Colletotrichum spaethianum TaxID=700344 RepID=A0AA37LA89_9PEZI|nr:frataxin, mitochondrial [Colletotrichum spaethianum]GKT44683.1 frataxin, mitochondrial [Colletotrichum spaethianum]
MARSNITKLTGAATRTLRASSQSRLSVPRRSALLFAASKPFIPVVPVRKSFTTSCIATRGIMPDTDDPKVKETPKDDVKMNVVELTDAEYHELSDAHLETIVTQLEELADAREGIDVEYAAGVLTVTFPDAGTYVINKQPPNKQIWLSSPISGPKRYDWVIVGDSQNEKEGTAAGAWVYTRDGSTLDDLFLKELDIDLSIAPSTYGEDQS